MGRVNQVELASDSFLSQLWCDRGTTISIMTPAFVRRKVKVCDMILKLTGPSTHHDILQSLAAFNPGDCSGRDRVSCCTKMCYKNTLYYYTVF